MKENIEIKKLSKNVSIICFALVMLTIFTIFADSDVCDCEHQKISCNASDYENDLEEIKELLKKENEFVDSVNMKLVGVKENEFEYLFDVVLKEYVNDSIVTVTLDGNSFAFEDKNGSGIYSGKVTLNVGKRIEEFVISVNSGNVIRNQTIYCDDEGDCYVENYYNFFDLFYADINYGKAKIKNGKLKFNIKSIRYEMTELEKCDFPTILTVEYKGDTIFEKEINNKEKNIEVEAEIAEKDYKNLTINVIKKGKSQLTYKYVREFNEEGSDYGYEEKLLILDAKGNEYVIE